jgi:hypothetical protein
MSPACPALHRACRLLRQNGPQEVGLIRTSLHDGEILAAIQV